jgi:hypothetical protein
MADNIEHSEVQTDLRHFPSQDPPHVSSAATSHGNPEDEFIAKIAVRYSVSKEAVAMVLNGLKATGGRRVEFNHSDFGGLCHWAPTRTLVEDMVNYEASAKLKAVVGDLLEYLRFRPTSFGKLAGPAVTYRPGESRPTDWWPAELPAPETTGSQGRLRYAIFPDAHRLAIEDSGTVTIFDTLNHRLTDISRVPGPDQALTFRSDVGLVTISDLWPMGVATTRP